MSGIAHTRWATHGRVTEANCHPHDDTSGRVHVVMNGIVENWTDLKRRLVEDGAEFTSETDTEVVAHLVASHYDGDIVEAVRLAYNELRGHYSLVIMHADEPDVIVGARKECPLVVGVGDGESFIASAIPAFMAETRRVQMIENGEIVAITPEGTRFLDADGGADRARGRGGRLGRRGRREGRLRDLHAQGDLRAARRRGRDGGRPPRPRHASSWATSASPTTSCATCAGS